MALLIETPRLQLRELRTDDLDFVAALRADPVVMKHYPKTFNRVEAAAWIDRQIERYQAEGHGLWRVSLRDGDVPIGTVGVVSQIVETQPLMEVGYMLAKEFWRRGYGFEAARACRDWVFEHLDIDAVHSLIRPVNIASQGVARKNGMQPVRCVAFHGLDHDVWRISREDWSAMGE